MGQKPKRAPRRSFAFTGCARCVTPSRAVKCPPKELAIVATREIQDIQKTFASLRELGVVTSPYPQTAFCACLGVTVREIRLAA